LRYTSISIKIIKSCLCYTICIYLDFTRESINKHKMRHRQHCTSVYLGFSISTSAHKKIGIIGVPRFVNLFDRYGVAWGGLDIALIYIRYIFERSSNCFLNFSDISKTNLWNFRQNCSRIFLSINFKHIPKDIAFCCK